MTFEDFIKPIIEQAANRAAEAAVRRYAEEHKPKASKYGDRMTVDQVCMESGWRKQTIYQKNSNGEIPGAVKCGGRLMFLTAEVLPWLESGAKTK